MVPCGHADGFPGDNRRGLWSVDVRTPGYVAGQELRLATRKLYIYVHGHVLLAGNEGANYDERVASCLNLLEMSESWLPDQKNNRLAIERRMSQPYPTSTPWAHESAPARDVNSWKERRRPVLACGRKMA